MGGNRGWWEIPEGTTAEREKKYQWREVKQVADIKVLESKNKKNGALPRYANTPNTMYFHQNSKGRIDQLRIFKGRNSFIDIDWRHGHVTIPRGTPHVQHWSYDSKTQTLIRVGQEHRLSPYMWRKYGQPIMQADPTIAHR